MENKLNLSILLCGVLMLLGSTGVSAYFQENVDFSGEFEEGVTLYSDTYDVDFGQVWGRDVYPDRVRTSRQKVCEPYNVTRYERQCRENDQGYIERVRRRCYTRGVNYPFVCEDVIYRQPTRSSLICERVPVVVQKERCRYERVSSDPILCVNPDGTASNVLNLENFEMSTDGGSTWDDIPYIEQKQQLSDVEVMFRVNIPETCSPKYKIDKAITILS